MISIIKNGYSLEVKEEEDGWVCSIEDKNIKEKIVSEKFKTEVRAGEWGLSMLLGKKRALSDASASIANMSHELHKKIKR